LVPCFVPDWVPDDSVLQRAVQPYRQALKAAALGVAVSRRTLGGAMNFGAQHPHCRDAE
jgi:hypothetical protein